jgi:phosphoserine phosphatase RsbU/P
MNEVDQKKTVLVVDDAPSNIQIVSSILKDTYKIRVATNGAKALELMKVAPPPDLILLDVVMPDMNGYEVCSRLKMDTETRDVPVIFLTGQTEIEDETRGFDVGAVDYIHKPFSAPVVKARVQTHLALRGMRQQLALQLLAMQKEMETKVSGLRSWRGDVRVFATLKWPTVAHDLPSLPVSRTPEAESNHGSRLL